MADGREILKRLVQANVIKTSDAQGVARTLPAGANSRELAGELLKRSLITAFQADAVRREAPEELIFGGRFIANAFLDNGGMGSVFKAWQPSVGRWVAIKTMIDKQPGSQDRWDEMKQRFERELKLGKLNHPHIITIYDGDVQTEKPYLAMEYVEGRTLQDIVKDEGPRPWREACEWIAEAAEGLAHAHHMKVIHRDVKPQNLMRVEPGGQIKVLDFGLARPLGDNDTLTQTNATMGTFDYMAPEQIKDAKAADERADIYALGGVLYFLCVGKPMFDHRSGAPAKMYAHDTEAPPKLRAGCPAAPAQLEAVFQKMVLKRPGDRQQTMKEVIADLGAIVGQPEPARPIGDSWTVGLLKASRAGAKIAGRGAVAAARWTVVEPMRQPTKRKLLRPVVVLTAALAVGIGLWMRPGSVERTIPVGIADEGLKAGQAWSGNGYGIEFVWCPPGKFTMGSSPTEETGRGGNEGPADVTLTRGFWIAKFETTQDQWCKLMGPNPSHFSLDGLGKGDVSSVKHKEKLPVETVSWKEAMEFCRKLTEEERKAGRLLEGWEYTLPTEAQWEYACRAGTPTAKPTATAFGNSLDGSQANFNDYYPYNLPPKQQLTDKRTKEVGSYAPNSWGLFDMHGNVSEACWNLYSDDPLPSRADPQGPGGPESPGYRVIRGGSWRDAGVKCRSAQRETVYPEGKTNSQGFRIALSHKRELKS